MLYIAKTRTNPNFKREIEELKLLSKDAFDWLMKRPAIY